MAGKSQEESEAFVKLYQLEPIAKSLEDLKQLIKDQNATYITKDDLTIALQTRDSKIQGLIDKDKIRSKAIWVLVPIVITLLANQAWQFIMNNGRAS